MLRPRAGALPRLELLARALPERPRGPRPRRLLRRTTAPSRTGAPVPVGGLSAAAPRESRVLLGLARSLRAFPSWSRGSVVAREPSLAHRVLPGTALYDMEEMYSRDFGEGERQDAAMAGFYVRHNTSIAFQCFALGFFLGLGTIYVLLSNGIQLGTVSGYVIAQGHGERFLGFVCGHSSFELWRSSSPGPGGSSSATPSWPPVRSPAPKP